MERSGPTPSAFLRASWPAEAAQEEHLLRRTPQLLNVRRLDDFLLPDRVWRAGQGGAENKALELLLELPALEPTQT